MLAAMGLILFFLPVIYLLVDGFKDEDDRQKELDNIRKRLAAKDSEKALNVINGIRDTPLFIGDIVRIADAPATRTIGASGKYGTVRQAATPSTTKVDAIGTHFADAVVGVFVDDLDKLLWFYPDLVTNSQRGTI